MKRFFMMPAYAILLLAASCSSSRPAITETTTSSDAYGNTTYVTAPAAVQTSFTTRYPGATHVRWSYYNSQAMPVDWDLTDWEVLGPKDYTVYYDMDGNQYYAWYDANGNWIGSTYALANNNGLPAAVNNMVSDKFPGYTISHIQNVYWKDRSAYQLELNNGSTKMKVLADANGNILKQKTKSM